MSRSEKEIAQGGLDVTRYPGKWRIAEQYELNSPRTGQDSGFLPYWERVRLTFLELGGCYLDQNERDRDSQ